MRALYLRRQQFRNTEQQENAPCELERTCTIKSRNTMNSSHNHHSDTSFVGRLMTTRSGGLRTSQSYNFNLFSESPRANFSLDVKIKMTRIIGECQKEASLFALNSSYLDSRFSSAHLQKVLLYYERKLWPERLWNERPSTRKVDIHACSALNGSGGRNLHGNEMYEA